MRQKQKMWSMICLLSMTAGAFFGAPTYAQTPSLNLSDKLPTQENLLRLREQMAQNPDDLAIYFHFAQMAGALGEHESAATALEHMLESDASLERIRLDLGMVYMQLGRLEEAQALMQQVLNREPPEAVRENILLVLRRLEEAMKTHDFMYTVSAGINHDSNANSVSSSGRITVLDTDIQLNPEQLGQGDAHFFVTGGVNHTYTFREPLSEGTPWTWRSSAMMYKTEQSTLDNLNLSVYTVSTGPEITFTEEKVRLAARVGYNHIVLDNSTYLQLYSGDMTVTRPLTDRIIWSGNARYEWRDFDNSPGITTFDDRTGQAYQLRNNLKFVLDEDHLLDIEGWLRREETTQAFLDNKQWQASVALTKTLPWESFAQARIHYRKTNYDGPDFLISSARRKEKERGFQLNMGTKLTNHLSGLLGYQYRDVNSNIQNFTYDNHRFTSSLSVRY